MNKILNRIAADIGWIVSGFILLLNMFFIGTLRQATECVSVNVQNFLMMLLLVISGFILLFAINKLGKVLEKKSRKFKICLITGLLIIYGVISIFWINYAKITPVADSKQICEIATNIAEHKTQDISLNNRYYLVVYPHQIGLIMAFAFVFRIFGGEHVIVLQIINAICNIGTLVFMYLILKKFFKEYKPNFGIYWWLGLTFVPLILLSTFVYGDYIGLMFTTISIYFIMQYGENEKVRYLLISAVAIALSILAKKNYCVPMLAIAIYLFLNLISKKRTFKEGSIKTLLIVLFVIIAMAPQMLISKKVLNNLNCPTDGEIPATTYLAMGITNTPTRGAGWYNEEITTYSMEHSYSGDRNSYNKDVIKNRIKEFASNPGEFANFYGRKNISMWAEPTYQSIWYNYPLYEQIYEEKDIEPMITATPARTSFFKEGFLSDLLINYQKILVLAIFIGTTVFVFAKRKKISNNAILLVTVLIGGFMFHILWEAKGRYVMPYVIMIIPIATIGLTMIYNKVDEKIEKYKAARVKRLNK